MANQTVTDISFVFGSDASTGTYVIEIGDISASFELTQIAQQFTVSVGQVDGSDVFLVDNAQNKTLNLSNGHSYLFDLSYDDDYTFGLATDYDASGNTEYTDGVRYVSNYMIVDVSTNDTLYYYETSTPNMGNFFF